MISFNLMYDSTCHLEWYQSAIFSHLAHGLIVNNRLTGARFRAIALLPYTKSSENLGNITDNKGQSLK